MEFNDLSEKEQKLVVSCKYDLFRDKAIKLKEKGIDNCIYDFDFDFKGVKITGLGIGGFYYFMSLFFLERRRQLATRFEGHTMDSMLMRNSVTGNEMWLVNKVDEISDEEIERYMKK